MKLKSNTLLLILGILFVLICGLSYFFYTKYKSTMEYVNKQLNLKLGQYDFNLKKQITEMLEQYKNYLTQDKPIYKNPEEEKVVENLLSELQEFEETDLQFDESLVSRELDTIKEEIINEQPQVESKEVNDALDNIINDIEAPKINFERYIRQDETVEEIADEIDDMELTDEELADLVGDNIMIEQEEDEDYPIVTSDDEEEYEDIIEPEIEEEHEVVIEPEPEPEIEEDKPESVNSLECEVCDLDNFDDFVIEEKKQEEDRCCYIMPKGKRKGQNCGKKIFEDDKCKKHSGKYKK